MDTFDIYNVSDSIHHHLKSENENLKGQIEHYKHKYKKLYQMFETQKEETMYWMEKCQKLEKSETTLNSRQMRMSTTLDSPWNNRLYTTPTKNYGSNEERRFDMTNGDNHNNVNPNHNTSRNNIYNNNNGIFQYGQQTQRQNYGQQGDYQPALQSPSMIRNKKNEFKDTFRDTQRNFRTHYIDAHRNDIIQLQQQNYNSNESYNRKVNGSSLPPINDRSLSYNHQPNTNLGRSVQLPPIHRLPITDSPKAEIKVLQPPGGKSSINFG